jgi:hypothetical protein
MGLPTLLVVAVTTLSTGSAPPLYGSKVTLQETIPLTAAVAPVAVGVGFGFARFGAAPAVMPPARALRPPKPPEEFVLPPKDDPKFDQR